MSIISLNTDSLQFLNSECTRTVESKTATQRVTKVIVFGFVSLIVLSLALLSISMMFEELRQPNVTTSKMCQKVRCKR